ncbi:MAG: pilus assembly protein, partial [Myxococcaceae bacterium]
MRTLFQRTLTALALAVAAPSLTHAQQLCQDDLSNDKQGAFKLGPDGLTVANDTILLRKDGRLQLNTNLKKLDSENITFPFDQNVTIDYVYESAGASHSLGYMYMDDVKLKGYADANGNLVDLNDNGVLDLHEALYNLTPDNDTVLPVKYVGKLPRRCNQTFTSGGKTYMEPELAMGGACARTFVRKNDVTDARPGRGHSSAFNIANDWVGSSNDTSSDNGLFPHIPNLLEPAAPENGYNGIGRMVFLLVDDDSDRTVTRNLGPVADVEDTYDGIPDYNVSQYDFRGLKLPAPATTDPEYNNYTRINSGDRRVNLGLVEGGKEIV